VQKPDVDDYKKLSRVVCYLRSTKLLSLTLEANDLQIIQWWVDASFAVHHDMRSHTGGTMSLGKGAIYSTSVRQKLNTKSSTEAELVGVDDLMPMILWTRQFMEGQGYTITDNVVYQVTVEYCPTGDMLADVFTKPLQGAAFAKFRRMILNLDDGGPQTNPPLPLRSVLENKGDKEMPMTMTASGAAGRGHGTAGHGAAGRGTAARVNQ
jgi:hypothetical protein